MSGSQHYYPPEQPYPKDELPPAYTPGPSPPQAIPLPGALGAFQALVGAHAAPSSLINQGVLGIYHTSRSDFYIARSAADATPLFYAATHGAFSSQPDVTLHVGGSPAGPLIATANSSGFGSSLDISLFENGRQTGGITLTKSGWINVTYGWSVRLPAPRNKIETFEWKDSGSDAVRMLAGSSNGMECRSSSGELVAVFARPSGISVTKLGKFHLLPKRDGTDWGDGVEGLVLMALVGLQIQRLKRRRQSSNNF